MALMKIDEALSRLDAATAIAVAAETVPLAAALGRILAEPVVSTIAVPGYANSAMDGWALRHADLPPGVPEARLPVAGRAAAGHPFAGRVPEGTAIRILTGAPLPEGADTVVMQEQCKAEDGFVTVPTRLSRGEHCRPAGEDVFPGTAVLAAGTRLRAQELGLAAAVGRRALTVYRPLRAAVFSTGDELRDPGTPLPFGCIHDSNRFTAAALLRGLGAEVSDLGILPDKRETIRDALAEAAAGHHLVVTSGGVSVGEEDHVKAAVEANGSLDFWKLAIKPGKPIALGRIGAAAFLGLPGNPVAVMVAFMLLGRPLALKMMGATALGVLRLPVIADFAFRRQPGRREWLRARLKVEDGVLKAEGYANQGSGVLSSMAWADGLVEVAEEVAEVSPGDRMLYIPFTELTR
ncbi:MAG: molybdopterin molybdotransferase MoeA [Magnetospirillum sp.]|nr:molybdopterin molybdotransferase MoeA [Magnetospirillum sp.]